MKKICFQVENIMKVETKNRKSDNPNYTFLHINQINNFIKN